MIRYVIRKNKVWREVLYKNTVMGSAVAFQGKNKKECEAWINDRKRLSQI